MGCEWHYTEQWITWLGGWWRLRVGMWTQKLLKALGSFWAAWAAFGILRWKGSARTQIPNKNAVNKFSFPIWNILNEGCCVLPPFREWQKGQTTLESSRLESCLHYETKIAKRFHGKQVISWPLIAWDFKKHPFLRGVRTIFCNKMFSARQIRHLLVASDITISPFLSHNHISISV